MMHPLGAGPVVATRRFVVSVIDAETGARWDCAIGVDLLASSRTPRWRDCVRLALDHAHHMADRIESPKDQK